MVFAILSEGSPREGGCHGGMVYVDTWDLEGECHRGMACVDIQDLGCYWNLAYGKQTETYPGVREGYYEQDG